MDQFNHPLLQLLRGSDLPTVLKSHDTLLMSGKKPLDIMKAARLFLSFELLWTGKGVATDNDGNIVRPNSQLASSWSVEGAIAILSNNEGIFPLFFGQVLDYTVYKYFLSQVQAHLDPGIVVTFREFEFIFTYEMVMHALDLAIKELEEHGPNLHP